MDQEVYFKSKKKKKEFLLKAVLYKRDSNAPCQKHIKNITNISYIYILVTS